VKFSFLNLNLFSVFRKKISFSVFTSLFALCAVVFALNACSTGGGSLTDTALNTPAAQPGDEKVRIALLLPLTAEGRSAQIAKQIKQAGELALFEADNPNIELITKDTKGTPGGARQAASAAVAEGAEIVLGPLFAASVRAATPIVQQSNVPMIAFSSDESVAGNGVYLLSFLAGHDVSSIVSYAVSQGKRRFSAYLPQDQYGKVAEIAFRNAVASHGGEVVALATYPKDPTGLVKAAEPFAEQVKDRQADALFMPAGQQYLPQLATLIPYYEIDAKAVQILGSSRWDFASVGTQKPLVGGWFPAAEPRGWNQFKQRYTQTYGIIPTRITTLSYDAVSLAVSLANQPKGQRFSVANLTQPGGFAGVDGLFRLNQNGLSERRFAILQVQKFSNKIIQPSPKTFGREAF
jgi:ABC-type branched-subunit amino acid transport system substrate-binding protein